MPPPLTLAAYPLPTRSPAHSHPNPRCLGLAPLPLPQDIPALLVNPELSPEPACLLGSSSLPSTNQALFPFPVPQPYPSVLWPSSTHPTFLTALHHLLLQMPSTVNTLVHTPITFHGLVAASTLLPPSAMPPTSLYPGSIVQLEYFFPNKNLAASFPGRITFWAFPLALKIRVQTSQPGMRAGWSGPGLPPAPMSSALPMQDKLQCYAPPKFLSPHFCTLPFPLHGPPFFFHCLLDNFSFFRSLLRGHLLQKTSLTSSPSIKAQVPLSNLPSWHLVLYWSQPSLCCVPFICLWTVIWPIPLFLATHMFLTPLP